MGSIHQFEIDLTKFHGDVGKLLGKITRAAALTVFRDVVEGSPVDTGRFKSSWMVGVGQANRTVAPVRAKKNKATGSGIVAAKESLARLRELTPENVTGKEPIILSSNLPYATRLAGGSSDQAPDGWIDAAVARAVQEINLVKVKET